MKVDCAVLMLPCTASAPIQLRQLQPGTLRSACSEVSAVSTVVMLSVYFAFVLFTPTSWYVHICDVFVS